MLSTHYLISETTAILIAPITLLLSLKLSPDQPYVLNYLAYSWLERNYKIPEAIEMLELAYKQNEDKAHYREYIGNQKIIQIKEGLGS